MPADGNILLLNIDSYIDNYCMIFNEQAYIDMLAIKANDEEFLASIEDITATAKLNFLEEISKEFNIDLAKGIEYIRDVIDKQSDVDKLDSFFDEIARLNRRLASDKSGNDLNAIRRSLENVKNDISMTFNKEYNEEVSEKINDLYFKIKNFETIFNRTLESFIFDKDYDDKANMRFNTSRIWATKYGIYTQNLNIISDDKKYDENTLPQEVCTCSYLDTTKLTFINNKVFSPLVLDNQVYISEDNFSISCYDINKKTLTKIIQLNDEIISSGALMYLVNQTFIILCCKEGIRIVNVTERKQVENIKTDYAFKYSDNIEIKSINVFNNRCYINVCDYKNDTSYLYLVRFDFLRKTFVIKVNSLPYRILSNVILAYDKKSQQVKVAYITNENKLVEIHPDTLDSGHEFRLENEPIDTYLTNNGLDIHFSYPIISFKGDIFYVSATKRNQLYLYKIELLELLDNIEGSKIDDYTERYEIKGMIISKNGQLYPAFTNLIVDGTNAYLGSSQLEQTQVIPYSHTSRRTEPYMVKDNTKKRNITFIKYQDNFVKFDTMDLRALRVLAICQRNIIACEDFPQEGKYKLYVLNAIKDKM